MLLRWVPSICIFRGVPALLPRLRPPTGPRTLSMTIQSNPVTVHTNYFPISIPQSKWVILLQQCKRSRRLCLEKGAPGGMLMGRGTVPSPFSLSHPASSLILVFGFFMEHVLSTGHAPFCLVLIMTLWSVSVSSCSRGKGKLKRSSDLSKVSSQ